MFGPFRTGYAKLGLAGLVAAFCAACSVSAVTYGIDRYGTVTATQVHLGCHDTYEVYDRPDAAAMLVTTGPANEAIAGVCGDRIATMSTPERLRRIAQIFLEETSDRPTCTIVQQRPLSEYQAEFSYRCPPPPPKPVAPVPRLSGRR